MTKEDLYRTITATVQAPRPLLVEYSKLVANEAQKLPEDKLSARSGDSQFREPYEPGELLAAKLFHALVMQRSLDDDLQSICAIAEHLQSYTDDLASWREFFDTTRLYRLHERQ